MRPTVCIVGRPNVGKSSLFNRLIRSRKAVVDDRPGVTRDRNIAVCHYEDRSFFLVDTGGFWAGEGAPDPLAEEVRRMAMIAVEEADVTLVLFDSAEGLTTADRELVDMLRRAGLPVVAAVNKMDHPTHSERLAEFYELGFKELFSISAAHKRGISAMLDEILRRLPPKSAEEYDGDETKGAGRRGMAEHMPAEFSVGEAGHQDHGFESPVELVNWLEADPEERPPVEAEVEGLLSDIDPNFDPTAGFVVRVAVLGRPNVGKSTLVNRLLGFERTLVSPMPGTTRDSIDSYIEHGDRGYILVDTAGVRRKSRISDRVEIISSLKARRTIDACHVVLLVVDGSEGITEQDARLAGQVVKSGRACILVVNKLDLLRNDEQAQRHLTYTIETNIPHLWFAPVVRMSALTGKRVTRLFPIIDEVQRDHAFRIGTGPFNRELMKLMRRNPPPQHNHHRVKIYYGNQVGIRPPTFLLWANQPDALAQDYRRYLSNHLLENWKLRGTPLRLLLRKREDRIP